MDGSDITDIWTSIYIYIYIYMCVCLCVCLCVCACLRVCAYICVCVLEVVSVIPAGSTIIYWPLCGLIYVSLCQSIKIKPTKMYIASTRAQFKINTHVCCNWHLCIPDGLSVVLCSLGHVIGIMFLHNFSGMKRSYWTTGSFASVWRSWVQSRLAHGNLSVPLWVYMRFPALERHY